MSSVKYTPMLKLKFGEVTALSHLKDEHTQLILPFFEVVFSGPRKDARSKGREEKMESIVHKFLHTKLPDFPGWLKEARGEHPFILDFNLIFVPDVRKTAIETLLSHCAKNNQNVIVSIHPDDDDDYKKLVYELLQQYGFGLCVRITKPNLDNTNLLNKLLDGIVVESGLSRPQIDLLVDIKEEQNDQKYTQYFDATQDIPLLNEWRNLIFANGAFPASMGGLKSGKEHDLSRTDWIRYNAAVTKSNVTRIPIYADYSVRHPIYDVEAEKHSPSPSLKYTTESNWKVMKGADNDYGHYFVNSLALVSGNTYYGEDHCWGDSVIKEKADMSKAYLEKRAKAGGTKIQAKGAGSSEDWIAIGISHHTAVTIGQLSSRF